MAFLDITLPSEFSENSTFGPGFETRQTRLDNKQVRSIPRYPIGGLRRFNLTRGNMKIDTFLALVDFAIVVDGAANSFRVRDWLDYATTPTRTTHRFADVAVTETDEILQDSGDGLTFYLVTRYQIGTNVRVRRIFKPVPGTVKISVNDVEVTTGFSVSNTTGEITFLSVPAGTVKGGCEFDVPMRFTVESEQAIQASIRGVETAELPAIEVEEDVDPGVVNQERDFGGTEDHGDMGGSNVLFKEIDGTFQTFFPVATGLAVQLPDPDGTLIGGYLGTIRNNGGVNLAVETLSGTPLVAALTPNTQVDIYVGLNNAGSKVYFSAQ